jgi:hypothetical protein
MRVRPNNPDFKFDPASTPQPKVKSLIHNVHILDASGSMEGPKYNNAVVGIKMELEELKKNKNADFTQTLIEFCGYGNSEHFFMTPMEKVGSWKPRGADGGTPLYITVGTVLTRLRSQVKSGEKVLVKIFTDGGDTEWGRGGWDIKSVKKLIDSLESEGFTIAFVGTDGDVANIVKNMGVKSSNTLSHDNSAAGVKKAFDITRSATMMYSKSVVDGLDVKENFYTKTVETN